MKHTGSVRRRLLTPSASIARRTFGEKGDRSLCLEDRLAPNGRHDSNDNTARRLRLLTPFWGALSVFAGCGAQPPPGPINPFTDLPAVALDGVARDLTANLAPLGELSEGEVIRVAVRGNRVDSVLILSEDTESEESGVIAGGGPANQAFDYRIPAQGRYFVFVLFETDPPPDEGEVTLAVGPGAPEFRPPERQVVQVLFDDGFLSEPGLFDPVDGTDADRDFLEEISPIVRDDILATLRDIFADTPIEIIDRNTAPPDGPFSRLRFSGERVVAAAQNVDDSALPAPDPTRPQCQERVVFGEVLPSGTTYDAGNRVLDDEAVVYVGSLQGRGQECWTAIINSLNNVVLALAQTAAHEIGHLVGLGHVEQIDIMNRTATLAFQRELALARGQLQIEVVSGGRQFTNVLTTVIQDPDTYFRSNFSPAQ